jgi:hypothetical protein
VHARPLRRAPHQQCLDLLTGIKCANDRNEYLCCTYVGRECEEKGARRPRFPHARVSAGNLTQLQNYIGLKTGISAACGARGPTLVRFPIHDASDGET